MAARKRYEAPAGTGEQRRCARGPWCSASTRDTEGTWQPALTWQPYCTACTARIVTCLTELPPLHSLLCAGTAGTARRSGRAARVPPGPRIHVNVAAEALAKESAALLAGWAARVRDVPGLRLSRPEHPAGTPERAREDCRAMAMHPGPFLALALAPTSRIYDLPEGGGGLLDRASAACRKCRRTVTRSRASGWWWSPDGQPAGFCDHDPGRVMQAPPPGPVPDDLEDDFGDPLADEEIVSIGHGWIKVMRLRDGVHAGAEILDLHWQAGRLTGQAPAGPEPLDGMPCRNCDTATGLVRAELPAGPEDPENAPPFSRCQSCRDVMTRAEYDEWARMYAAWTKGSGILTCRRCDLGNCPRCCWDACTCRASGHPPAA